MTVALYGIPNCDTVKKARGWLETQGVAYRFHDFKKQGIEPDRVARWIAAAGLDTVLNRRGTTFRALPDDDKDGIDAAKGTRLMVASPSLIKRPVVEYPGGLLIGFRPAEWAAALG